MSDITALLGRKGWVVASGDPGLGKCAAQVVCIDARSAVAAGCQAPGLKRQRRERIMRWTWV